MIKDREIKEYISKACNFLINDQNEDGSWSMKNEKVKQPPIPYQKSLILTSQALQSLLFNVKPRYVDSMKKAINFCINYALSPEDAVDLWAWKLDALELSNTEKSENIKEKSIQILEEKQEENGSWPYYPDTFALTNYSVCNVINLTSQLTIARAIKWFNNSKKGSGWSKDDKDEQIEPSFTANAILSLIKLGETPPEETIKYLEEKQEESGGWRVLSDSGKWGDITSYSTALCILALILSKGNNEKIDKGITYLLNCQDEKGKILRTPKERETYHYLFYYVIKTLIIYLESEKNINRFKETKLREFIISCYKNVLTSRALGVTERSRKRRIDILKSLGEESKEVAEIIDSLKKKKEYEHLNKKSHITQIKSDVEYLRSIKLIGKIGNEYYISLNLL